MSKKIYVGLSGGVDSAVTAAKLIAAKHDVTGIFMKNWHDEDNPCDVEKDELDARAVCKHLSMPLETIDLSKDYYDRVFQIMLNELKQGLTPNPDILCNEFIKFQALLDHVESRGADFLATGHYAGLASFQGNLTLRLGIDKSKDQTYFLSRLPYKAIEKICFPLNNIHKEEVRNLAINMRLPNAMKKDSTGICFIGERKFKDFISQYLLDKPGDIVTSDGEKLGEHRGLFFHTIGQRKGLNLGGISGKSEEPWYVSRKDIVKNQITVVQGSNHPDLFANSMKIQNIQWSSHKNPLDMYVTDARIRHQQAHQACEIAYNPESNDAVVTFKESQRAITPGQYCALYHKNLIIGNGQIVSTRDNEK